ncbi:SRPBCC domain-containing protein [Microcella sp.]|uniref:SRPBCC family protein n=1 Tax=Microcella sp. TaxID=1913979 RepID=UPI0039191F01
MTVRDHAIDRDALTLTFVAEFSAPVERVWQVWADPRQLERWWGPPEWPASFSRHELEPGGEMRYVMTGPDGETSAGWWRMTQVEAPHRLAFDDGFAGADGEPAPEMPVMVIEVNLGDTADGGTRMTVTTTFPSLEALDELAGMGMVEGMSSAMAQIDALLAAG